MKVLIIGSKGFIGSHALRYFSTMHETWGCDVFTDYNEKNFFLISASHADFKIVFEHQKFDVCINCSGAASVPASLVDPSRDFELNVQNVFRLLDAIRVYNPTCKFINLSSAAVYGNPVELPMTEGHPLKPLSPYGWHKLSAEQLCKEFHTFFHLQTASLRIFSAFGPGLKKQLFWDLYMKMKNASSIELFGTGQEARDYVFIDDIVFAMNCVANTSAFNADVYNVASGCASKVETISYDFAKVVNWKGAIHFTGAKREGDPDFWQADISKIKGLGFVPQTDVQAGIKRYAEWLQSLA